MAVYTELNEKTIRTILNDYDVGELVRYEPIASGIENTNYFIWTENQACLSVWVLTIFENITERSLPFFNSLTQFLSKQGFSVPAPILMRSGADMFVLNAYDRKFGVLVPRFLGVALETPEITNCQAIGEFMAKMHLSLAAFDTSQAPPLLLLSDFEKKVEELMSQVPSADVVLITSALERYAAFHKGLLDCPQGVVHGDLFRDNVLFEGDKISGVIDFYNAGATAFLFDLAVAVNDWAVNFSVLSMLSVKAEHEISSDSFSQIYNEEKVSALLMGYQKIKPLSADEKTAWPKMMELAAFRFYLSRLKTKYLGGYQQKVKAGNAIKSPDAMRLLMLASMSRSALV